VAIIITEVSQGADSLAHVSTSVTFRSMIVVITHVPDGVVCAINCRGMLTDVCCPCVYFTFRC
jgi:hypothetical protein